MSDLTQIETMIKVFVQSILVWIFITNVKEVIRTRKQSQIFIRSFAITISLFGLIRFIVLEVLLIAK